ncbi:MAG: hypothetical protein JRF61_14245 [Deltaproteobacteria bacterium]|nr:hypothetical protein [Deltaproteobacteria bacterium]
MLGWGVFTARVWGVRVRRSWVRLFSAAVLMVAVAAGYVVSSGLGERLLHREIERQLTRLLRGPVAIEEVILHFDQGLRLEALGLEAFPGADPLEPPAVRAPRVLAEIDSFALLIGRLELGSLVFEGPQFLVKRAQDGSISNLPIALWARTAPDEGTTAPAGAEGLLARIETLDAVTTDLLEEIDVANRLEVRSGTVHWIDHSAEDEGGAIIDVRLELLEGVVERSWLSDSVRLDWSAVFLDGQHAPFPIELSIEGNPASGYDWQLGLSQVPVDLVELPPEPIAGLDDLSGTLAVNAHLTKLLSGVHLLELSGALHDARLVLPRSGTKLGRARIDWDASIELDGGQLHLSRVHIADVDLEIDLSGSIARPIRPTSLARFESRVAGLELEDIVSLARSLESESETALAITRMTRRVEGGQIDHVFAAGTARLDQWEALASAGSDTLPDGFMLGGAFREITVVASPEARLQSLQGEVEWVGDQIGLRNLTARYRDQPLPELDLVIDGVSHLFAASDPFVFETLPPPALPGIGPLAELIKPRDPDALPPVRAIGLAIEELEHPLLRFPMRDLRVYVEPLRRGLQLNIREGRWGEVPIRGEAVFFNDPESPSVSASVVAGPLSPPTGGPANEPIQDEDIALDGGFAPEPGMPTPTPTPAAAPPEALAKSAHWGRGRFEVAFRPRPKIPFENAQGFFHLEAGDLHLKEVEIELVESGEAAARAVLDLTRTETVGIDLSFALTDGDITTLSPALAIPADLATGQLQATGSIRGDLRPHTLLIAEVEGEVRAEAREGTVRTKVPLLFRLTQASEGYNPFAKDDELSYESMRATVEIDRGELTAEDFVLEGPLRVFASARIGTTRKPADIRAVVGIFLFRAADSILDNLPLVRALLPGSEHGLIGAYFEVEGPIAEPEVDSLPMKTLISSVPGAITAPFKVLRFLFDRGRDEDT